MVRPGICAVITRPDPDGIGQARGLADLFEVRIDLIGKEWRSLVGGLGLPWIACNRWREEGGGWQGGEDDRVTELISAVGEGAAYGDIELAAPDCINTVKLIKQRARSIVSHHDFSGTPSPAKARRIIEDELGAGADICKLVTTANNFEDNLTMLGLAAEFPGVPLLAFCMGEKGTPSRILAPLADGEFAYASLGAADASAPGQLTVEELRAIYGMIHR